MNYVQQYATDKEVWNAFDDLFRYYERSLKEKTYTYPDNEDTVKSGYDILKTLAGYKDKPLELFWGAFNMLFKFYKLDYPHKKTYLDGEDVKQILRNIKTLQLLLSFIEVEMSKREAKE